MKLTLSTLAYLACILFANWALQRWGIITVGPLTVPAGVFFAGLAFGARDVVQEYGGRKVVVAVIVAGSAMAWWIEPTFAFASGTAFLLSELLDLSIYTPLRNRSWPWAVTLSNLAGSILDSLLFLWLAFDSIDGWIDLTIGKALMILPALAAVGWVRRTR